jgi:hypothetical protein
MTKIKFTDGIEFDTSGPFRAEERPDGWYVVGQGKLIPVKSEKEAKRVIKRLLTIGDKGVEP